MSVTVIVIPNSEHNRKAKIDIGSSFEGENQMEVLSDGEIKQYIIDSPGESITIHEFYDKENS